MAKLERRFALQVQSSTENLALIREFVSGIGTRAGLGEVENGKLELAVDEACANIIEHAYQNDMSREVVIRVSFDDEALQIIVEDTGRQFDPESVPQSGLQELVAGRKTGGLGLRLMKTLMDEVHYERVAGEKNELRMVKRLKKADAKP